MSYFSKWQSQIENSTNPTEYQAFVEHYYSLEKDAYEQILTEGKASVSGQAAKLAKKLGFGTDLVIFLGFLDGINSCLNTELDLEAVVEDTEVELAIDFEKVYWKMHEAKADWLYELPSWDNVLSADRRHEITKSYRQSKIIHREKIGRNDPCPCGSGKKYKACCGKNV
ncbi:MAG: SEC-C metal-binding domain-containing protein [Eubacteriales bacterium]|nr:SEC-C metal-binding domain-containing protein [Eubacteriales bacterium]